MITEKSPTAPSPAELAQEKLFAEGWRWLGEKFFGNKVFEHQDHEEARVVLLDGRVTSWS